MLSIGDFRAPELAWKRAAPDTAIRSVGIDDAPVGVVKVAARELLRTARGNVGQLCDQVWIARQPEDFV